MKIFDALIQEIKDKESKGQEEINSLESFIKSIAKKLLDETFNPSKQLKILLDKYLRRARYPMEVAIVGQFSSGKSTFLNALLCKDILPTGITPVTSKVNFLNYGAEYKLKITFKSGATEFHNIEHLAKFTDQREAIEDVKYLSIYAPVEMLKDISFVDTPGLNSQSKFDTDTTNKILRDVDGIIWLGLIDAVAKKTELDILDKYLPNYANKSICLLNQKDRLDEQDVETALFYAKQNYKNYFSKISAISAKQALDSRIHQKDTLLFDEQNRFALELKAGVLSHNSRIEKDFFTNMLDTHNENVADIEKLDFSNHLENLKKSNILDVLEFIDKSIRPQAKEAKIFAIKKDLSSLCEILQNEYTRITVVYADLSELIYGFLEILNSHLDEIEDEVSRQVKILNIKINENINENVNQIYSSIKPLDRYILKEKKSLLGSSYVKESYQSYVLDTSDSNMLSIKDSIVALDNINSYITLEIQKTLKEFEKELLLWQVKNEKITKNREVASDIEFSNMEHFAAGIYERIYKDFVKNFDCFKYELENKLYKLSLKNRFEIAYEKTKSQIILDIVKMQSSYESSPETSVINSIDESEILLIFKENLDFEYLKREFQNSDSFVKLYLRKYNTEVESVVEKSISKIRNNFDNLNDKVRLLDDIKSDINTLF